MHLADFGLVCDIVTPLLSTHCALSKQCASDINITIVQGQMNGSLLPFPWTVCILQTTNLLFCYYLCEFKCLKLKINIMWLKTVLFIVVALSSSVSGSAPAKARKQI